MATPPRGSTRDRGRAVEQAVAEYLAARGLEIIDRNYHAPTVRNAPSVGAEVDLIARQPCDDGTSTIVFVEVRSRASSAHGSPLETVDRRKQRRNAAHRRDPPFGEERGEVLADQLPVRR